jgi:hypothetical protein
MTASSKVHANAARSRSNPTANEAKQKIEMIIQSTAKPNSKKRYPAKSTGFVLLFKKIHA